MACLNLVKNDIKIQTKKIFPRFSLGRLLFRTASDSDRHAFCVHDLGLNKMNIQLKDGGHHYKVGEAIAGVVHLKDEKLKVAGVVLWVKKDCLGLEFSEETRSSGEFRAFCGIENLMQGLKPLQINNDGMNDIPLNLKYWLKSDGGIEIFVWDHLDGEIKEFQIFFLGKFVEWKDGIGVQTGKILFVYDIDTPLNEKEEIGIEYDNQFSPQTVNSAMKIALNISEKCLVKDDLKFLQRKLKL